VRESFKCADRRRGKFDNPGRLVVTHDSP
jgi:hypothetical protein